MPIGGKDEIDERLDHCRDQGPALFLQNLKKFGNQTFMPGHGASINIHVVPEAIMCFFLSFSTDGLLDVKYTFKQLHDNAVVTALALRKLTVGEGTYVALLTETTTIECLTFSIGVWLAGGCVCLINTCILPDEIAQILEICAAELVYCDENNITALETAKRELGRTYTVFTNGKKEGYITVTDLWSDVPAQSKEISSFSTIPYDPYDHITYLLFTSGTTGVAKGVMLSSYASLVSGGRLHISKGSTLVTSPPCWVSNASVFINSLLEGTELIVPRVKYLPVTKQVDLLHIARCVEKYKPEKWMSAPSFILDLCYTPEVGKYEFSSLRQKSLPQSLVGKLLRKSLSDEVKGLFSKNELQGMVTHR